MKNILFSFYVILSFLLVSCSNNDSPKWTEETLSLTQENLEDGEGTYIKNFDGENYVYLVFKNGEMKVLLVNVYQREKGTYLYQITGNAISLTNEETGEVHQIGAKLLRQGESKIETYLILDGDNLPEYIQSATYTKL
ncbi:MAG TPA: hypothetical protein OIM59_08760 [Bacteroides mediterraneensis]|uniref:hypothetical protein n=1 Tax=Bacteroides mediterraneensis TaxID=1841856 RepID=UPI0026EAC38A|nr:hypothetical protein [Bacteroides mediterraneensis]HJH64703.1 hypothetical protein [Bacteroides mediterraneensis]